MGYAVKGEDKDFYCMTGETLYIGDNAIKFSFDDLVDDYTWIPRSQLEDWPRTGEHGDILMTEWIAQQKGFV